MNTKLATRTHISVALVLIALCSASLALSAFVTATRAQSVETGIVKLANSHIEYFSRGEGEAIVLLPGGTLTVGYLDGLANALAKAGYRVSWYQLPGVRQKHRL
jgi:hypothetical protein